MKRLNGRFSGSSIYVSFAEFRYYILKYILYARDHYPDVYDSIIANESFRKAFAAIDEKFKSVVESYRARFYISPFESEYQPLISEMEKEEYTDLLDILKP